MTWVDWLVCWGLFNGMVLFYMIGRGERRAYLEERATLSRFKDRP